MKTFDKLALKIKKDTGLEVINLKRRYVGIHMKASGAFCWAGQIKGSRVEVGGATPATELLKAEKLCKYNGFGFGEIEICASPQ